MISANAKTKMRNAVLWLDASAKYKWCYSKTTGKWFRWRLNFIHLTIPAQAGKSDKFVKKVLNRFFMYAYRKTGMRSYIWKAEPQERGEIHFHITSDCFIWKTTLQNIWNGCLRYYGLIGTHENPPSTKVHPTANIKLMTAYLVKYMTKNDNHRRIISGRLWGCSQNLSQAKNFHLTISEDELSPTYKELEKDSIRVDSYDWLTVFNLKDNYFERMEPCPVLSMYREKIRAIQQGYVADSNLFFNEEGKPMSFESAVKKGLPPAQQALFEEQLLISSQN
ncbi:MAG: hypothetical protein A2W17_04510 [Planctomycetes bacterium RBG_16_41_13]|nr:MAG: hypothetical protein A2W17_04510 [Planctomycetes bacterium RBG_16_41_13]